VNHSPALKQLLADPAIAPWRDAIERDARPCWRVSQAHVATLRPSLWQRLRGVSAQAPTLPAEASKRGGTPYLESADAWPRDDRGARLPFIAQLNFAELPALAVAHPRQGILTIWRFPDDPKLVGRWTANPTDSPCRDCRGPTESRGEWRLVLTPGWSIPPVLHVSDQHGALEAAWAPIAAFTESEGPRIGGYPESSSISDGPPEPACRFIELWDELLGDRFGSVTARLLVERDAFERADLNELVVEGWQ